jgi:LmbE family N-acetylglucosaminyl deacetylase
LVKKLKTIVIAPHPDDEILGSSGLLYDCFLNKLDIKVIYMTSGKSAGGYLERQIEAINGIKILGGSEENCIFACFPFYNLFYCINTIDYISETTCFIFKK